MESRTLKRDDLVWEATRDGCRVEVAFGPADGDDSACHVETLEFESPRTALEYVDEAVQRLTDQGFELCAEQPSAPSAGARPLTAVDLGRILSLEPRQAENPEMLAAIQADPDDDAAYLVYADWLQEQGDPRGELMVIQYAARRSGAHARVAARVVAHFKDQLLPRGCDTDAFRLRWELGFIEGARISGYPGAAALAGLLSHPSARVLRELSVDAGLFCRVMLDGDHRGLPCLKILKLDSVNADEAKRLRAVLEGAALPGLRQLSLREVDDLGAALAPIVASGRLTELELLDVACDEVRRDRRLRWAVKRCAEIPATQRPRLCLTVSDDDDDDDGHVEELVPEALESLRQIFTCIEPDALPRSFALEEDRRHEADDDDEIGEDILDRICGGCGAPMEDPEADAICAVCGHNYWDDYGGYDEEQAWEAHGVEEAESEVCLHDAGRDPSRAPPAEDADSGASGGVDQRWEAFKDDVFDIDEA